MPCIGRKLKKEEKSFRYIVFDETKKIEISEQGENSEFDKNYEIAVVFVRRTFNILCLFFIYIFFPAS